MLLAMGKRGDEEYFNGRSSFFGLNFDTIIFITWPYGWFQMLELYQVTSAIAPLCPPSKIRVSNCEAFQNPEIWLKSPGMMIGMGKRSNLPWTKRWLSTGVQLHQSFLFFGGKNHVSDGYSTIMLRWAWTPSVYIFLQPQLYCLFDCCVCLFVALCCSELLWAALSCSELNWWCCSDFERVLWQCCLGWGKN